MAGSDNTGVNAALDDKHVKITQELQELQVIETYLFDELSKINQSDTTASNQQAQITAYVENLKKVRTRLMESLKNLYTDANADMNYNSQHLSNQQDMSTQLTLELEKAKTILKNLKAEKNNKTRLAQIGEYEFEKNREHRSILKTIVYGSFFVLIVFFINSKNIIPDFLTKIIIVIISSITFLLVIQRLYWNSRRNNIDYSKFSFPKRDGNETETTENKNTLSLRKIMGFGKCDIDLQQLAQDTANPGGIDGFSNINVIADDSKELCFSNSLKYSLI
jgi:cbb3-type cytochrome oxidase subunit 3/archaellum component FlaC